MFLVWITCRQECPISQSSTGICPGDILWSTTAYFRCQYFSSRYYSTSRKGLKPRDAHLGQYSHLRHRGEKWPGYALFQNTRQDGGCWHYDGPMSCWSRQRSWYMDYYRQEWQLGPSYFWARLVDRLSSYKNHVISLFKLINFITSYTGKSSQSHW